MEAFRVGDKQPEGDAREGTWGHSSFEVSNAIVWNLQGVFPFSYISAARY